VSQETADLLKASGRSSWVKARDKMVEVSFNHGIYPGAEIMMPFYLPN